jgi:hypothetical protein
MYSLGKFVLVQSFASDSPTMKVNTASLSAYLTISLARKDPQVLSENELYAIV